MTITPPLREEINQLHAHICSGLADSTRIMILYTLTGGALTVSQIVAALEIPQPTVSRHLKMLRTVGLVEFERNGQYVYYRLKDPRVIDALNLLRDIMSDFMQERAQLISGALPTHTSNQEKDKQ